MTFYFCETPQIAVAEQIQPEIREDWSNCKQEEYMLLQDDGAWCSLHLKMTFDEVNVYGEYTSNCRVDGGAIVAGNNEAKIESLKAYQNLLRKVFNLN